MKDNLRSGNEKYVSNDTSCKQRIKLWDGAVKNQRLKMIDCIFEIAYQRIQWNHIV